MENNQYVLYPDFQLMIMSNSIVQYGNDFAQNHGFVNSIFIPYKKTSILNHDNLAGFCDVLLFTYFMLVLIKYLFNFFKGVKI